MGGGATRLYSALTQTSSSDSDPLSLHQGRLNSQQAPDTNLDPAFCQVSHYTRLFLNTFIQVLWAKNAPTYTKKMNKKYHFKRYKWEILPFFC